MIPSVNIIHLCILVLIACALKASAERPPNIVFIFQDDLGYADLASYGHPYAVTPHLDRLAAEGTSFMQHYVTGVTCNPSRTGLMTGIYPARNKKYAASFGFQDLETITSLLKQRGYATGHFGKWHIGPKETEVDGMYGIDQVEVIGSTKTDPMGRDAGLFRGAIEFIKENKDQPFYVNIWGHSTHFPVSVVPELASKFIEVKVKRSDFSDTMQKKFDECLQIGGDIDASMHQYLGDVYSVDLNVGEVLKALDELGISDDTIVVFSSDHGPAPVILSGKGHRQYSNNMLGYAGIFRGAKHNLYEGGTRVPFIIRWPGKVPAGRRDTESVTSFIDWLPTLCSIAGVEKVPDNLDGQDISDIWLGESRERGAPLFWKFSSKNSPIVMRDGDWKLHLNARNRNGSEAELYNLKTDPTESTNLAETKTAVFDKLSTKLKAWGSTLPQNYVKSEKKKKM
ncbi:MAG: sulfatase-like hydrolase/transferase [Verrucomicrobiota bacterium]